MEQPRLSRRAFVGGVAAAAVAVMGTGGLVLLTHDDVASLPPRPGWLPPSGQARFRLADLGDDDGVYAAGARRSTHPTGGYRAGNVAKATIAHDPHRLVLPGADAGLVVPTAGLVPRDAWTATVAARNTTSNDVTDLVVGQQPVVLLGVGPVLVWLLASDELAATHLETEQQAVRPLASGEWPADAWRWVTVGWRSDDATLWLALGTDGQGQLADEPVQSPDPDLPPGGVNSGLLLGGSDVGAPPFELSGGELHAGLWRPDEPTPDVGAPTLAVDADDVAAAWPPGLSGTLVLYAGFELGAAATDPDRRDEQYALVYDEAGSALARLGGPLNLLDTEPDGDGSASDTSTLDAELDALLDGRPSLRLHLTLDYTPPWLQPEGGDHRSPPTDPQAWAEIAAEVVAHVADRYGQQLHSVTLWNEPDFEEYWTGTAKQLYELWELTQTRLLDADHGYLLGSPEYAFTPGIEGFFAWLADRPQQLQDSVSAVYVHDFQQDLFEVRTRLAAARAAASSAGIGDDVPLRLTEYNLALGQIAERRNDPDSWYATQPAHFTTEYAPAHAIHLLWEALDQDPALDAATFAALGAPELFWGEQALTTSEDEIRPLPAWSAIAVLARLDGRRITAAASWPAVRALATRSDDGTIMVVYASFRPYRGFLDDVAFDLDWAGLPDAFTWQQWQLDRDHVADHRPALVGDGDESDLPARVRLGALGLGGIRIEPR